MAARDDIVLMLTGDVMTGRGIDQLFAQPGDPQLHEPWVRDARDYVRLAEGAHGAIVRPVAPDYPWGDALAAMAQRAPAWRIANLETAVTRRGRPWPGKGIHYRMHPANIECLRTARLDAVSLANNHVLDWDREGLEETLQSLRAAGIQVAGAGAGLDAAWAPVRLARPMAASGGTVLLFALATTSSGVPPGWAAAAGLSGIAWVPEPSVATARRLAATIRLERRVGDLVVVSVHWGGNWGLDVPPAHRDFAHALVDEGAADVVHGHSSHHPLPLEVYQGRLILYGCGDLINDYEGITPHGSLRADVGCLYFVSLDVRNGALQALEIVPLRLRRLRLERAGAAEHAWLRRVFDAGADLGPQPQRTGPGAEIWQLPIRSGAP